MKTRPWTLTSVFIGSLVIWGSHVETAAEDVGYVDAHLHFTNQVVRQGGNLSKNRGGVSRPGRGKVGKRGPGSGSRPRVGPTETFDEKEYVECADHMIALMDEPAAVGRVFNIGSDQPISILDLARHVIAASGSASAVEFQSYSAAYDEDFEDIRRRVPDLTRLRATIDYQTRYDLAAIVRELIDLKQGSARDSS